MSLVKVFSSIYSEEIYFLKTLLEQDGLEVTIFDEHLSSTAPHLILAIGGMKLAVHQADAPKAQAIIQDYLKQKKIPKGKEFPNLDNDRICPNCESRNIILTNFTAKLPTLFASLIAGLPIPFRKTYYQCRECGAYWKK